MKDDIYNVLTEYNNALKENDDIYRIVAKTFGLSECIFWILYVLRMEKTELTQSGICQYLYEPKQTVNSALKKLEADGLIALVSGKDKRCKYIRLTERGSLLAGKTADRVIQAEGRAFSGLSAEEREMLIDLLNKYNGLLKEEITSIEKERKP